MFEDFRAPTLTERLRSLCLVPLAAFLTILIGSDLESVIGPSPLFYWIVDTVALAGAFGIGIAARLAFRERHLFGWRAAIWLLLCLALSLLCAHVFVVLTTPYPHAPG